MSSNWAGRGSRHERGYGRAWELLRAQVLKRDNYLCQACLRKNRVRAGNECHHLKPKAKSGEEVMTNLETLCSDCHLEADAKAQGRALRQRIGADGWPIDE